MTSNFTVSRSTNDYAIAIASRFGILQAIRVGDAKAARRSMNQHLDRAESVVMNAIKEGAAAATVASVLPA